MEVFFRTTQRTAGQKKKKEDYPFFFILFLVSIIRDNQRSKKNEPRPSKAKSRIELKRKQKTT